MKLEQLEYALEIEKHRSLSKAAKSLYISQPALTIALNNLEKDLNYKIFQRSSLGAYPTTVGQQFLDIARRIAADLNEIRDLSETMEKTCMDVGLAALPSFTNVAIFNILTSLSQQYPHSFPSVFDSSTKGVLEQLKNGTATIGLTSFINELPASLDSNLEVMQYKSSYLYTDRFELFMSQHHPLAQKNEVKINDFLGQFPMVYMQIDNEPVFPDQEHPFLAQIHQSSTYAIADKDMMKKHVCANLAVAVLPSLFAHDAIYVNTGQVRHLPIIDLDIKLLNTLIYPKQVCCSYESALIEAIEHYFKQL